MSRSADIGTQNPLLATGLSCGPPCALYASALSTRWYSYMTTDGSYGHITQRSPLFVVTFLPPLSGARLGSLLRSWGSTCDGQLANGISRKHIYPRGLCLQNHPFRSSRNLRRHKDGALKEGPRHSASPRDGSVNNSPVPWQ
jgi:hypothetical protein